MSERCVASLSSPDFATAAEDLTLQELFEKSYQTYETLQDDCPDIRSDELKMEISRAISFLEEATRKVNTLGIFSSNETLDEIATADLKYLLLPALLGNFTLKLHNENGSERNEILKLSEVYYRDFMERCTDYGVTDDPESQHNINELLGLNNHYSIPKDMENAAKLRENKIRRYKKGKELKNRIKEMKSIIKIDMAEEILREYYMVLLKRLILEVQEDLEQIDLEKKILNHITQLPVRKGKYEKIQDPKPLEPIIITKNVFQKKVYGAGYPSLPVMTVDEFYQQRYPQSDIKEPPTSQMGSLQLMASDPDAHKRVLEEEDEEKETKIENDDPVCLQHARDFDDWKDENRRGCGNRKNMG